MCVAGPVHLHSSPRIVQTLAFRRRVLKKSCSPRTPAFQGNQALFLREFHSDGTKRSEREERITLRDEWGQTYVGLKMMMMLIHTMLLKKTFRICELDLSKDLICLMYHRFVRIQQNINRTSLQTHVPWSIHVSMPFQNGRSSVTND